MATFKGIISFPTLFVPKIAKGADEPKFSCSLLFPPTDPQVAQIQAMVSEAKATTFPSGYTGQDECFEAYDTKYANKEYYDPRFRGWYTLSLSAKADAKPDVVGMDRKPILDANKVCSGSMVWVNFGISGYTKGRGGIGGWLNGVMATNEEMPFGRLDGKPSVDQMFADVGGDPATGGHAPAHVPAPAPAPVAPPVAPAFSATAKANGATVQQMLAWEGWTQDLLIQHGYILPAATPSFA